MFAVLAILLAQASPSKAPEVVANLQWAFGRPVVADWQPLLLDLQSASARDLDLDIVVREETSSTRVVRRESLPARGRRRVFLHLPTGRLPHLLPALRPELSVRDAGGRELATFALAAGRTGTPDAVLLGLLAPATAGDLGLGQGWMSSGASVELVRLAPESLPDRWTGLAPLRALLLHDAPLDALTPEQALALRDYVRQGGTLLVPPTAARGGLAHPVLAALAEIRMGAPVLREKAEALRPFGALPPSAPFRVHPLLNGRPLSGLEDAGVAVFDAGFGRVVALPYELHAAPFHGWTGLMNLLGHVVAAGPSGDAAWVQGDGLLGGLDGLERRAQLLGRMESLVNPFPSFLLLVALTGLYLALVGPLNYVVLRRLRMTLLLVVTVPALSVGFLVLTLGLGFLVKGRSTTVTSVTLLSTAEGLPCARETGVTTLFSPTTRAYAVVPPPGRAAIPFRRLYERARGAHDGAPLEVEVVGGEPRLRSAVVGQWESWAMETRAVADLGAGLRWRREGNLVRLENGTPLALERALLVGSGPEAAATPLGAVPPGGTAQAAVDPARWSPLEDLGFGATSLGGLVLEDALADLRGRSRYAAPSPAQVPRADEWLVAVVREAGPGAEVDARRSADSRSLTLLVARRTSP